MNLSSSNLVIETERLFLASCSLSMYEAILRGDHEIADLLGIRVPKDWTIFGDEPTVFAMERVRTQPQDEHWFMFMPIHKTLHTLLGAGGYKGGPDAKGVVEIGYEIASDFQNQGYATEYAKGLIQHAFDHPAIKTVKAHTLAEPNYSTRVLKNCGMEFVEELFDPDDGAIWQWKIDREIITV